MSGSWRSSVVKEYVRLSSAMRYARFFQLSKRKGHEVMYTL